MLKTLQLGMHWFPERQGGLDRVFYQLSRALPDAGVAISGLIAGSDRAARETGGAIRAFAGADKGLAARWLGMRRAFAQAVIVEQPDVVVSHFALYTFPILDLLRGRPLVVHFQGPWADEGVVEGNGGLHSAAKRQVERLVYRRASQAIVLSRAFGEVLATNYGISPERIHVIPGGVDSAGFPTGVSKADARVRLGWPVARPIIVAVRRLVPRMGLETLVTAIDMLRGEIPDIQLMIAGRGVLQARLASQIAALGLGDHVRLLGFVADEDLPFVYRAANMSVVPTVSLEGFGLIAAESLAAGTPCLVSPVGGLPEVVAGLSRKLILASPSAADIAAGIGAALRDPFALPDEIQCHVYAAANFDWRVIARRVAEVYAKAAR